MSEETGDALTEKQRDNIKRILAVTKRILTEQKKEATVGQAIYIANREAQIAEYFRTHAAVDYDSPA